MLAACQDDGKEKMMTEEMVPKMMKALAGVISRRCKEDSLNTSLVEMRKAAQKAHRLNSSMLPQIAQATDNVRKAFKMLEAIYADGLHAVCDIASSVEKTNAHAAASSSS